MFDISFWEIGLVIVVALLIFGPERLPELARKVGKWVGSAKRMWMHVKQEAEKTLDESTDKPEEKS